ncbi:MAG: hypothetical protein AB1720_03995 [Pseudomonadota bacterium]
MIELDAPGGLDESMRDIIRGILASPGYGISWALIVPLAAVPALFSFAVAGLALAARRRPVLTGGEEVPGMEGEAVEDIATESGRACMASAGG